MKRNKLQKFAELLSFPNAYENFDIRDPKLTLHHGVIVKMEEGWGPGHFNNDHPITVELACGRGEYSVALGERYPERNFIGVDIKGARIWKGARQALQRGLNNVAFLRTRIELLYHFFKENEIDQIWITFPDPFLKKENRRLTSPRFLEMYYPIMHDGGTVHLKTDSKELYDFTLEVLEDQANWRLEIAKEDIHSFPHPHPDLDIMTYYEKMHLEDGRKINYLRFSKI